MKRTLSLVLTLLMLLTLCSGFAIAEEEHRVLTMGGNTGVEEFWNYDAYKMVQEELNMTIEYTEYTTDSFNAMLAGGDLPDILNVSGVKMHNLMSNKLAFNYEPYIEEYCPNLLSVQYSNTLAYCREMMSDENGGLYVFCPTVGLHNYNGGSDTSLRGYVVNWEYYKELGCPEMNNDEEYLAVLTQMWENHPTTEEGLPIYLFGVEKPFGDMGGYHACFTREIGLNTWCPYMYKNSIYTNELVNCYTDLEKSSYWHDMEFYNTIYRMGGFDLDSFTMTYDEFKAKADKGQYIGNVWDYGDKYVSVPAPGSAFYANIIMLTGQAPSTYSFISADSENWDLALKFINYLYDEDFVRMCYSGVQGKDWDYDENGVPALTDEALADIAAGDEYWSVDGNGYNYRLWQLIGYNPAVKHSDGHPMDLTLMPEAKIAAQDDFEREFAATYGVEHWSDAFTQNEKITDFRNSAEGISGAIMEMPMDYQRTLEACNDLLYTSMPLLIMAESDEEFAAVQAEVLAEVEALGEAEVWEWYKAEWEAPKELYNKLIKQELINNGLEPYEGLD